MPKNAWPQYIPEKRSDKSKLKGTPQNVMTLKMSRSWKIRKAGELFQIKASIHCHNGVTETRCNFPPLTIRKPDRRYETMAFKHCTKHNIICYLEIKTQAVETNVEVTEMQTVYKDTKIAIINMLIWLRKQ